MRSGHFAHRGARPAKRPAPLTPGGLDTYDRLYQAGRLLFAQHGYEATSVRDITHAARANLSAVSYYFGSKHILYSHILGAIIGPLARKIGAITQMHATPPLQRVENVVRTVFMHIEENPDLPQFMVRELSKAQPSSELTKLFGEVLPRMAAVIDAGQRDATIRQGDPRLMTLSIFAQPVYLYLTRNATRLQLDDLRIVEHAVAFVHAGLEQQ